MKLFGALESFVNETLGQIPGRLGKLRFIAEMRNKDHYEYWGMSKMYGDEVTQRAIAEAHADEFEKTLTTPVPELADEVDSSESSLPTLPLRLDSAVPSDLRGGTKRHFRWVLKVVELLHHSPQPPNRGA